MAAPKVEAVRDGDGGATLYATVDGVAVAFATVNPSQFLVLAAEQQVSLPEPDPEPDADAEV